MTIRRPDDENRAAGGGRISRRQFIRAGAAVGAGAAVHAGLSSHGGRLIDKALEYAPSAGASLNDIEHIVFLMQENRSFDHYYGVMSGVRGYQDPAMPQQVVGGVTYPVTDQFGYQPGTGPDPNGYLQPFHLLSDPPTYLGQATNDISHSWGPQHQSWNNGAMDQWVNAHLAADGTSNGPLTMGYFTNKDLAFYYALADAFTIGDAYFCSVLGPTDPNRCMWMSGSIDPAGTGGGPILDTSSDRVSVWNTLSWTTIPEVLQEAGISWKVYADSIGGEFLGVLQYFKAYWQSTTTGTALYDQAFNQSFPTQLQTDVTAGTLPAVSWILPPVTECEHPATPPEYGEYVVQQILNILVSNPDVWAKTLFIVVYDENGGWFDHVPPPTAPPGTPGEYVTVNPLPSAADGIAGPIGLGFRVPCLIVSPFSRGGYLSSEVLDHTSCMRLLETRFGITAPNITAWRRATVGDFTQSLALKRTPNTTVPTLPTTSLTESVVLEQFLMNTLLGSEDQGTIYPLPSANSGIPQQMPKPVRKPVPY